MTGMTALLIYIIWTLILALSYATYRLPLVLTGKKSANHWERGKPVDDPIGQSLVHLIGTSFPLVFIRASLFLIQVALMLYLAFSML